jgi:hypothetical protein
MKSNSIVGGDYLFTDEGTDALTVTALKQWIKIPDSITTDDDLLSSIIKAARLQLELYTGISFVTRTVSLALQVQLGGSMEIPFGPIVDLISVKDISEVDLPDDAWTVTGVAFKRLNTLICDEISLVYTAGYETLPDNLLDMWKRQAAWKYEHRGDELETKLTPGLATELSQIRRKLI